MATIYSNFTVMISQNYAVAVYGPVGVGGGSRVPCSRFKNKKNQIEIRLKK